MTWSAFFKSRPFTHGSLIGVVVFLAGSIGSAAIALYVASKCSLFADFVDSKMAQDLSIPEITGVVNFKGYHLPITLHDINAVIPSSWIDVFDKNMDKSMDYCFYIPFFLGVCITLANSLAVASAVAIAVHIRDQKTGDEEPHEGYSPLRGGGI